MRPFETLKEKYLQSLSLPEELAMIWAKEQSAQLNKSEISLSSYEGYLLYFFIKSHKCLKVVEIGTLTGYSSLWISKALPASGQLWTIEKSQEHANIASQTFIKANDPKIHLLIGDAKEKLLEIEFEGPFDAIFIDGNKSAYLDYLNWSEKNLKSGGLLLADNTLLRGSVYSEKNDSPFSIKQISKIKEFNTQLATNGKFESLLLPTEEGFTIALKK
jgi:predicted O-methyltransferase YrrM